MNTARAWILVFLLGAAGGPASLTGQKAPGGTPRPAGQAPRVLFEDDFHSVRRWREGGSEACKTSYGDRGFIVEDLPPQGSCEFDLLQAGAFPDHVRIELSVRLRKGDLSSPFGLKFGRGPMDNHLFHTFTISADGTYDLALKDKDWRELLEITHDPIVRAGYGQINRLAVEIQGHQIRCFVNDKFLGAVLSPADIRGAIGLYLDTVGMEVVFSNLRVLDLSGSAGSAAAPANPSPGTASAAAPSSAAPRVIFEDDFIANQSWSVGTTGPCKSSYGPEGFIVEDVATSGTCEYTLARVGNLPDNVRIEISVALRQGSTRSAVGLKFGQTGQDNPSFYTLTVNAEGAYRLSQWNGEWRYPINWTLDPAVNKGYGATNRLAVEIHGQRISCYINDRLVGTVTSAANVRGETGVFLARPGLEAAFSRLRIVELATP